MADDFVFNHYQSSFRRLTAQFIIPDIADHFFYEARPILKQAFASGIKEGRTRIESIVLSKRFRPAGIDYEQYGLEKLFPSDLDPYNIVENSVKTIMSQAYLDGISYGMATFDQYIRLSSNIN